MTNNNPFTLKFSYDEHSKTCDPKDFLRQVCRTVNGMPVSEEQIAMIIAAIKTGLKLKNDDVLLDLACGNGSLSQHLFDSCGKYLGVDLSDNLISIAKINFEISSLYEFKVSDALNYIIYEQHPERYTKVLCYSSFQYFSDTEIEEIFSSLFVKYKNVSSIFIGNIPDKQRADCFYKEKMPSNSELQNTQTAIGAWRSKNDVAQIIKRTGWQIEFQTMPNEFYASYYRYDALLSRHQVER